VDSSNLLDKWPAQPLQIAPELSTRSLGCKRTLVLGSQLSEPALLQGPILISHTHASSHLPGASKSVLCSHTAQLSSTVSPKCQHSPQALGAVKSCSRRFVVSNSTMSNSPFSPLLAPPEDYSSDHDPTRQTQRLLGLAEQELNGLKEHAQAWLFEGFPSTHLHSANLPVLLEASLAMRQYLQEHNMQLRQHNSILRRFISPALPLMSPLINQTPSLVDPWLVPRIPRQVLALPTAINAGGPSVVPAANVAVAALTQSTSNK